VKTSEAAGDAGSVEHDEAWRRVFLKVFSMGKLSIEEAKAAADAAMEAKNA
jgi:hypothetical protein